MQKKRIFISSVQVKKSHYTFLRYVNLSRWNSYYHQIEEVLELKPASVLIVGAGDNIVTTILKEQGVKVTTFDFDETLHPDIIGDVNEIEGVINNNKSGGGKFDVLLCCQVLEHLPYENFENILRQFAAIANNVIISLPYSATYFKVDFKIPHIRERRIMLNIHKAQTVFKPSEEHYWEIGFKGYSKRKIIKSIKHFFAIKKQLIAKHNHYHLFFILTTISA